MVKILPSMTVYLGPKMENKPENHVKGQMDAMSIFE